MINPLKTSVFFTCLYGCGISLCWFLQQQPFSFDPREYHNFSFMDIASGITLLSSVVSLVNLRKIKVEGEREGERVEEEIEGNPRVIYTALPPQPVNFYNSSFPSNPPMLPSIPSVPSFYSSEGVRRV